MPTVELQSAENFVDQVAHEHIVITGPQGETLERIIRQRDSAIRRDELDRVAKRLREYLRHHRDCPEELGLRAAADLLEREGAGT